jgi:cytochrome oxidase Cu insertion factor (SCO1/SenC/PrrC family)
MSEAIAKRKRSRAALWLLLAVCIAPVLASYIAFYLWPPSGQINYGELIEPRPLADANLSRADGTPFEWRELKGKWVLAIIDSGRCDAYCREKLVYMRQVRLAQGKDAERIERVWLLTDQASPEASLVAAHPGIQLLRVGGNDLLTPFPAERSRADHIYVVDPLGNLMMRYPRNADPRKMLKDVTRLLRHSKWR